MDVASSSASSEAVPKVLAASPIPARRISLSDERTRVRGREGTRAREREGEREH